MQQANAAVIDSLGNTWIVGYTGSSGFPTVNAPFSPGGGVDAFLVKLDPSGNVLLSTCFGGSGDDRASAVGLDSSGNIYIAGTTSSSSIEGVALAGFSGASDGFVVKLDPTAHTIRYAIAIGGSDDDLIHGMSVTPAGTVWVAGETASANLPVTSGALQKTLKGSSNAFVAQLTSSGALAYCTYLGGSSADIAWSVAADSSGAPWVVGSSKSTDFPLQSPLETHLPGSQDAFVAKLSATGSLLFSTYFGGSGAGPGLPEYAASVAVDSSGNAYVAGIASSSDFPVLNALQPSFGGWNSDAFLAGFNSSGALRFSTFLGGSAFDMATSVALMPDGRILLGGYTLSSDFPLTTSAAAWHSGGYNGFLSALDPTASTLLYSTYVNQGVNDAVYAVAAGATPQAVGITTPSANPGETLAAASAIALPFWGCQLSPLSATLGSSAATGSVTVTASDGYSWTAASNASWLTIQSGAAGWGNGTVGYSVTANSGASARTATLTIGGQTSSVTQNGTPAGSGNNRSFVSPTGSDSNTCSATAWCQSLNRALAMTASGGEIVVIASGSYAPVVIQQPVTITATGITASITAATGNAITINTTGNVTITGLRLFGMGTGYDGVQVLQAGIVRLCNVSVQSFTGYGIEFDAAGSLSLYNSRLTDNQYGLAMLDSTAQAYLHKTSLDHNSVAGLYAAEGLTVASAATAHFNGVGFEAGGGPLVIARSRAVMNTTGLVSQGATANLLFSYCSAAKNTLYALSISSGGSASGTTRGTSAVTGQTTGSLSTAIVLK